MPQGTNSTMCVGQAKQYQLCQQQVRTTSSTDWSSLGDAGLRGSHLELQEHQHSGCDWSVRGVQTRGMIHSLLEWLAVVAFEDVGDGLYSLGLRGGGKGYKNIFAFRASKSKLQVQKKPRQ